MSSLPPVLAGPLEEWAHEADPRLALWAACDAIEMTLRLSVALGLGDWARAGGAPAGLRQEVARRLETPTLGRWRGMAMALAAQRAPGSVLGDLWTWLAQTLEPLLVGADPSSSMTELRNRLAHGGAVGAALAGELLAAWKPRLDAAFAGLAGLADLKLVAVGAGVVLGDSDPAARTRAIEWARDRSLPDDAVVAVRGDHVLPLWPLVSYASPAGEPRAVPQVYVRRGEVRLVMTPLGAERAAVAESSEAAVSALQRAGLFAEPPAPTVTHEIAGFEADWKRDAGACVGRDDEVAAVRAALTGAPGLYGISGPPGSGKSFVVARALAEIAIAFRFRAGDARCTRDAFLRFVVERAGTPPKGKPLLAAAKELLVGRTVIVDGIDDIDADFVREVLTPIAKIARVIAIARAPIAGAEPVFPGGLPPMSPAGARAMLLDKIGPLTKRLVALDKDRGVNPFVDAVVARAAGLPVYVAYVIGDVLSGRLRTLDAAQLPPSLAAYHAAALRRGGAGAAQQLVTPLCATLALAEEPLDVATLHALMVHRVLATDDAAGRAAVEEALAQVASLLRREDDRFGLFHATLRDHVRTSADQAMAVATARIALARAARALALPYLEEHGVAHLVDGGDLDGAVAALAWPRIVARVGRLPRLLADLARVAALRDDVRDLFAFVRGAAHHVERGGAIALVQAALADGDDSAITRAASASPARAIRRIDRPARAIRGARQRTLVGHAAPLRALALVDGALVSASADGTLRVWDADDGSHLRTLAPNLATLSATTRAAPAGAPPELAGAMPVLGVHAVCEANGRIIAAHGDGFVRAWSLDGGVALAEQRIRTYAWGLCTVARAGAGTATKEPGAPRASASIDRIAVACDDGTLRLLDARTLEPIAETTPAAASAGGAPYLFACAHVAQVLVVAGASRGLGVLDPTSLTTIGELRGHDAPPRALAAVPGTSWLLSTARDGTLALWDVPQRKLLAKVAIPGGAWSVSPDALVGTRDGSLVRVRLPDLAIARSAAVHAGPIHAVVALPDGRAVTAGEDRAARIVDLEVAAAARPSHAGVIVALAAPRPDTIFTLGADGTMKQWDTRGRSLRTTPVPGATALAASGDRIFTAAGTQLTEHGRGETSAPSPILALASQGDTVLAACADGVVREWKHEWRDLHRHDGAALAVAFHREHALSGGADFHLRTGTTVGKAHSWDVVAVAAAGDTVASVGKDGALCIWAVACDRVSATTPAYGRALAVSPDGALVAHATRDDCVVVRSPDGTERARWTCDASPQVVAFAAPRTLVVGDAAGEIVVMDLGAI